MALIVLSCLLAPVSRVTVDNFRYEPVAVAGALLVTSVTGFIGGRQHFMKGSAPVHGTERVKEILNG